MSYIESTLTHNEKIEAIFDLSYVNYLKSISWIFFIFVAISWVFMAFDIELLSLNFLIAFIALATPSFAIFTVLNAVENGVTNRRFIHKEGITSRTTKEIRLEAIETVEIEQTIFGRLFNYGNVHITGRGSQNILLENIDTPLDVKKAIETAAENREKFLKNDEKSEK